MATAAPSRRCPEAAPNSGRPGERLMPTDLVPHEAIPALAAKVTPDMLSVLQRIQRDGFILNGGDVDQPTTATLKALADLGLVDNAWRSVDEAMKTVELTQERMFEAEINRVAGEITLKAPKPDAAKAQVYFDRALGVARQEQAKSWELRASMSLARLWRDQGKVQQARELLAPVYGWFTEGFDTRDLKEAKALLEELAA